MTICICTHPQSEHNDAHTTSCIHAVCGCKRFTPLPPDLASDLVEQAHRDVDAERARRGLPPYDWHRRVATKKASHRHTRQSNQQP